MSSLFKTKTLVDLVIPQYFDHSFSYINYGTAGFRTLGEILPPVAYRSVFFIFMRSLYIRLSPEYRIFGDKKHLVDDHFKLPIEESTFGDMGIMITASHNPATDNGLKIIDGNASNIPIPLEEPCTELCNKKSKADFIAEFCKMMDLIIFKNIPDIRSKILEQLRLRPIRLHVGRDTRPSGNDILNAIVASVNTINTNLKVHGIKKAIELNDHGILTTPALHGTVYWGRHLCNVPHFAEGSAWLVKKHKGEEHSPLPAGAFHWNIVYGAIIKLFKSEVYICNELVCSRPVKRHLMVDCANGVGAVTLNSILGCKMNLSGEDGDADRTVAQQLESATGLKFTLVCAQTGDSTVLNAQCGADYSIQKRTASAGLHDSIAEFLMQDEELMNYIAEAKNALEAAEALARSVSFYVFDGDADRVLSFAVTFDAVPKSPADAVSQAHFELIDGDHISCIYAVMVNELKKRAKNPEDIATVEAINSTAVIQTAYANGASTHYITDTLKIPCIITATGVKHLHHEAEQKDIGIYFEANGHGTLLCNPNLFYDSGKLHHKPGSLSYTFQLLTYVLSQCCGDAIADALCVEFALALLRWSPIKWVHFYEEFPSKTGVFQVRDPTVIKTIHDQTKTTAPAGLQNLIDAAVERAGGKAHHARAFVRPSGTEPVVRNYAEADTMERMEQLYMEVQKAVEDTLSKL